MLVVNKNDFPYPIPFRGRNIIIPNDNRPHEIPDELFGNQFGGIIIVRPPMQRSQQPTKIQIIPEVVKNTIVEIQIENKDEIVVEEPKEVIIEDKRPLAGKTIKKKHKEKLKKNKEDVKV